MYGTAYVDTEQEARVELARLVTEVHETDRTTRAEARHTTFDAGVQRYLYNHLLDDMGRDQRTVDDYWKLHKKWFSPKLAQRLVRDLTRPMFDQRFGAMRREGKSRSRMNQARSLYVPFFRWAVSNGLVTRHPLMNYELPTSTHVSTETVPPEVDELVLLLNTAFKVVPQSALRDVETADHKALLHDAERAVFERVLELGWTPDRFGQIDRGRGGRDRVLERVGKKYQWIGFYEVMGRIADNHADRPPWSGATTSDYEYAEQLVWRDTDPTVLVRKPQTAEDAAPWFSPARVGFPAEPVETYPPDAGELPDPLDLIAVTDPDGGQWLVLVSAPSWDQRLDPEVEALRVPRRAVWMQLHAYLVPSADAESVAQWSGGKDWFGRWMPDVPELHNLLLAAHPDAPEWASGDGTVEWWDARADGPQPAPLWQCAAWYGGTGTSRDASAEEETRGYVPSRRLFDAVGLTRGKDFEWQDESGLAVFDPAATAGGAAALLMRRDLMTRLAASGLTGTRPCVEPYGWGVTSTSVPVRVSPGETRVGGMGQVVGSGSWGSLIQARVGMVGAWGGRRKRLGWVA